MKFTCDCGATVQPPNIPPTLRLMNLQGTFKATIYTDCQKCGKRFFTRFEGKIEKEKI